MKLLGIKLPSDLTTLERKLLRIIILGKFCWFCFSGIFGLKIVLDSWISISLFPTQFRNIWKITCIMEDVLPSVPSRVMIHSNFYCFLKKIWWTWGSFMQMNNVKDPTVSSKLKAPPHSRSINLQPKQNYCHGREGNKKFMTDLKRGSWGCFPSEKYKDVSKTNRKK